MNSGESLPLRIGCTRLPSDGFLTLSFSFFLAFSLHFSLFLFLPLSFPLLSISLFFFFFLYPFLFSFTLSYSPFFSVSLFFSFSFEKICLLAMRNLKPKNPTFLKLGLDFFRKKTKSLNA